MRSPLSRLPASWKTDVVVVRSGGRDTRGNPLPAQEIPRKRVLVGQRGTNDPVSDLSDATEDTAVMYDADTTFRYQPTDRIRVPDTSRMSGEWSVKGLPGEWPLGTEIQLERG